MSDEQNIPGTSQNANEDADFNKSEYKIVVFTFFLFFSMSHGFFSFLIKICSNLVSYFHYIKGLKVLLLFVAIR